jgi:hypothetical protein
LINEALPFFFQNITNSHLGMNLSAIDLPIPLLAPVITVILTAKDSDDQF